MGIVNSQLTTSQLDILGVELSTPGGVPEGEEFGITNILVCNTYSDSAPDASDHSATFDMHLVPAGKPLASKVTCVIRNLTLPAGETFTFDNEKIVLKEGDRIVFIATPDIGSGNTDLAATVSYLEV